MLISQPLVATPSQFPNPALQAPSAHVPEAQDSDAFARSHTAPQVPQFESVVRLVSHPFDVRPSQLANPPLQLPIWHDPLKQLAPAFANEQAVPQEPQFDALVFVFVSQPLATLVSQLPKPVLQASEQVPALHVGVAFTVEHAAPQEPQLPTVVLRFVSQPFAAFESQLPKPAVHVNVHVPVEHDGVAFAAEQVCPHAPQFDRVFRLVSHPFDGMPSQSAKPAAQVGAQVPFVQAVVPFAFVHGAPQAPQFAVLVFRLASQPFVALPSQLPKPTLHPPSWHVPAEHSGVAFAKEQTVPHVPQFVALV